MRNKLDNIKSQTKNVFLDFEIQALNLKPAFTKKIAFIKAENTRLIKFNAFTTFNTIFFMFSEGIHKSTHAYVQNIIFITFFSYHMRYVFILPYELMTQRIG